MIKRVAMGLIKNNQGQILMALRRPSSSRPNMWEIPGGGVEPGEDPEDATVRELREELGVETVITDFIDSDELDLEDEFKFLCFGVRIVSGTPQPLASVRLLWTTIDYAIVNLPCVPTTYLFYKAIKRYLG